MRRYGPVILIFLFFLGGPAAFQWKIYETYKKPEFMLDRIYLLPNPEAMKILGAGYEATIVDLLWIRGIQYYGQHFSTLCKPPEKGEGLIDLFHTIIALDPKFKYAYKWGGFILTESMNDPERCPGGAKRAIDEFLAPAIKEFPDDYTFASEAGFTAFWHLHDNDLAVKYFKEASEVPGAPAYLARMIPYVRSKEDSFPSLAFAYNRYLTIYLQSENEGEKHIAESHLKRIVGRFQLLHLKRAVAAYRQKTGHAPANLQDLVKEGVLPRFPPISDWYWPGITAEDLSKGVVATHYDSDIPVSPYGNHYVYIPTTGEVAVLEEKQEQQKSLVSFLNELLAAYRKKYDRCPQDLTELIPEFLKSVPTDPLGMNYSIDPVDCTIVVEVL